MQLSPPTFEQIIAAHRDTIARILGAPVEETVTAPGFIALLRDAQALADSQDCWRHYARDLETAVRCLTAARTMPSHDPRRPGLMREADWRLVAIDRTPQAPRMAPPAGAQ